MCAATVFLERRWLAIPADFRRIRESVMSVEQYRPQDRAYDPEPIRNTVSWSNRIIAALVVVCCFFVAALIYGRTALDSAPVAVSASATQESANASSPQGLFRESGGSGVGRGLVAGSGPVAR